MARDLGLADLFLHKLRYEGTPGLWHLLLAPLARSGLPYFTLQLVAAAAAVAGAALLLLRSPLPLPIKLLAPFSYFLAYQYAIVARSYSLLPPLLFAAALLHRRKLERIGPYAAVLFAIANVSLHGFLIAAGLFGAHAVALARAWARLDARARLRQRLALELFVLFSLLLVLQLEQPRDLTFAQSTITRLNLILAKAAGMLNGAFSDRAWVTAPLLAGSAWWFAKRGVLLEWLLPTALLLLLFGMKYGNVWHQGTLLLVWLYALWLSFDGARQPIVAAAASALLALQVSWTVAAWVHDWRAPYSGSRAAAAYLAQHGLDGRRIFALGFKSYAVLPYFRANFFANAPEGTGHAYYPWNRRVQELMGEPELRRERPEYVLVGDRTGEKLELAGYEVEQVFPGSLFWKDRVFEQDAYILLRAAGAPR
jgi:hypothetical protein